MKWRSTGNLRLGSNIVELLLPHRRPYLFVDFVDSFHTDPQPTIEAGKHISASDPVFAGHFPDLHLWPGTLTIEGMGQASAVLIVLLEIHRVAASEGLSASDTADALRNLELGYTMNPGYRAEAGAALRRRLMESQRDLALNAAVDVKLHKPVFAGSRIDYLVGLAGEFGQVMRFDVEARVDGVTVASGAMSGARVPLSPLRRLE